jgi:hypothetical protein
LAGSPRRDLPLDAFPYELDGTERVARADAAIAATRATIRSWIDPRTKPGSRTAATFARFRRHFEAVESVLGSMLDAVTERLHAGLDAASDAEAYERSRAAERRVGKVGATFRWYASKYEQREGDDERLLLAADEVVRSCWDEPFQRSGRDRPTAPLCYLDESFDAVATPRKMPPAGIPAGDEVVGSFIQQLPVPTIALPATCREQPWWLAVSAHEVGHHVELDLDTGFEHTVEEVAAAAADAVDSDLDVDLGALWRKWSLEAFADVWAVLMVGGAVGWVLAEQVAAVPVTLVASAAPGSFYPPPLVRLALVGEAGRLLGVDRPGPTASDIGALLATPAYAGVDPDARVEHEAHLRAVPELAARLVDAPVATSSVRALSGWDERRLAPGGRAAIWGVELRKPAPMLSGTTEVWSARTLVAAAAWAVATEPGDAAMRWQVRDNVLEHLPTVGPEGDLAEIGEAEPFSSTDAAALAGKLADQLFAEVT